MIKIDGSYGEGGGQILRTSLALSLITGLEFMYKTAIIISMILFFSYAGTANSLIWGQLVALVVFMPVEYLIVNKRVLQSNTIKEGFLTMLPSLCVAMVLISQNVMLQALFLLAALLIYWFVYLKDKNFDLKIVTE